MFKMFEKVTKLLFTIVGLIFLPAAPLITLLMFVMVKIWPVLVVLVQGLPLQLSVALLVAFTLVIIWVIVKILRDFL